MHKSSPSKLWRKQKQRYAVKDFESGKLISWSTVSAPPSGFEQFKPYVVGIIEVKNGERITGQIVDVESEELKQGDELIPTFRKIYEDGSDGVIHYGTKWTKHST